MLTKILNVIKTEPTLILYAVNAILSAAAAYGLNLSPGQTAAVVTITTGLLALVTAAMTRPVVVSSVTGSLATIAVAAGAFGLHLSSNQIGATVPLISLVLALLLRQHVSPAPAPVVAPPQHAAVTDKL